MSIASAAPFSGLSRPAKTTPSPARVRPGDRTRRHIRREDRVDPGDRAPDSGLGTRTRRPRPEADRPVRPGGARPAERGLAERGRDRRVRGQVERVHHRRVQSCGQADGGRVEGVIVDQVIAVLPDCGIGPGKGRFSRGRVAVRRAAGRYRVATRDLGSTPVSMTVTPGICEPVAAYTWTSWPRPARPRARSDTKACEPPPLRLADGRHQRRHDRDLHPVITLKARSRGRVDAQHLIGDSPAAPAAHLRDRMRIEDLGHLHPPRGWLANSTAIGPAKLLYW